MAKRGLRVATFSADVTPPLGTPLCYSLVPVGTQVDDPLEARGVVLLPEGQKPIVLCAVDWLGIGNGSRDSWRAALAKAAGTTADRVTLHTVHQHDAPGDDRSAQALLPSGIALTDVAFAEAAQQRVARAIAGAQAQTVARITAGASKVDQVASNRRLLGPDGKVIFGRMTACRPPQAPQTNYCQADEGLVDPLLRSVSFWNSRQRIATLSYYATHPMSHYGKGAISADFVGLARRQQADTFQVHFTGAGGNIGAGRYNDGSPAMRPVLQARMAQAMAAAKQAETTIPLEAPRWTALPTALPLRTGKGFSEAELTAAIANTALEPRQRANHARYLAFLRLCQQGRKIDLSALRFGAVTLVHMPAELFVEYQLAAAEQRKGELIAMAAYGDYGPMYIGTSKAYEEGGYETSAVSRVAPQVEEVLLSALRQMLR